METKIMIGKSYYITANALAFSGYPDGLEFKVLGILTDGRDYPIVMGCDELGEEFFQSFSEEEWKRWGYILGLIGQPFWFYVTIKTEQWGMVGLTVFYTYSWIMGIWNYWIKK